MQYTTPVKNINAIPATCGQFVTLGFGVPRIRPLENQGLTSETVAEVLKMGLTEHRIGL
jgi:hypothetical protein